jgi:uncharacterized membrane protein YhaH (DUF805 family)
MRRFLSYLSLLILTLVVVGISFAIRRSLHRSHLLYVLFIPMWVTVLAVLVKVAWVTFRGSQDGNRL